MHVLKSLKQPQIPFDHSLLILCFERRVRQIERLRSSSLRLTNERIANQFYLVGAIVSAHARINANNAFMYLCATRPRARACGIWVWYMLVATYYCLYCECKSGRKEGGKEKETECVCV